MLLLIFQLPRKLNETIQIENMYIICIELKYGIKEK